MSWEEAVRPVAPKSSSSTRDRFEEILLKAVNDRHVLNPPAEIVIPTKCVPIVEESKIETKGSDAVGEEHEDTSAWVPFTTWDPFGTLPSTTKPTSKTFLDFKQDVVQKIQSCSRTATTEFSSSSSSDGFLPATPKSRAKQPSADDDMFSSNSPSPDAPTSPSPDASNSPWEPIGAWGGSNFAPTYVFGFKTKYQTKSSSDDEDVFGSSTTETKSSNDEDDVFGSKAFAVDSSWESVDAPQSQYHLSEAVPESSGHDDVAWT